ncbi:ATP-binding protein [Streptomyces sp. H27-C3]|uniref:ATP-binding protein n=1 Tax=Streptomyces sp. H27-C3 TaxID=3046305 RepID=UPI0024B9C20D|nr:ATP-binding protein [Streptomyces sp. H27-C3]MDJ0462342.1 ATP-binding protein [Streptomyces sp. H27-C3]
MAAHHQLAFTVTHSPAAAQEARHRVVAGIRSWGIRLDEEALDGIELAAGELITNAVRHTRSGPVTVSVYQEGPVLVVEVHDVAKVLPRPEPLSECAESGRGLHLVSVIADRHGADLTATGKRCWAEFNLPSSVGDRRADQGSRRDRPLPSGHAREMADRAATRVRVPAAGSPSHTRTRAGRRTVSRAASRPVAGRLID